MAVLSSNTGVRWLNGTGRRLVTRSGCGALALLCTMPHVALKVRMVDVGEGSGRTSKSNVRRILDHINSIARQQGKTAEAVIIWLITDGLALVEADEVRNR